MKKNHDRRSVIRAGIAITIACLMICPIISVCAKDNSNDGIHTHIKDNLLRSSIPNLMDPRVDPLGDPLDDEIIYVDDSNVDGPWDGSSLHPYRYIQDGITHASNGDTVFVRNGNYVVSQHIVVDKAILLIGENQQGVVISDADDSLPELMFLTVDHITVSNFTLLINYMDEDDREGVIVNSNNNRISNITLLLNLDHVPYHGSTGIRLNDASYNIISENTIIAYRGGVLGIALYSTSSFENFIIDNTISFCDVGIALYGSYNHPLRNNTITSNTLTDNPGAGILLSEACNTTISRNVISGSGVGVQIEDDSCNNIISENDIGENNKGIHIEYWSSENRIFENYIVANTQIGIEIPSSASNRIYHNIFINDNNANCQTFAANFWDNGYPAGGNYWDDHPTFVDELYGPDQDHDGSDGICDTSYVIPGNFNRQHDRFPLTNPSEINSYVEHIHGTIQYVDLEGGFYGIVADDGQHYDPLNLPAQYHQDGLVCRFSGRIVHLGNTHMWGTLIYLTYLEVGGVIVPLYDEED